MKVLILGSTGFAGRHLAELLSKNKEFDLYGTYRHSSQCYHETHDKLELLECDVNDYPTVEQTLGEVKPDTIFHFAAYVSVAKSFNNPSSVLKTNALGTLNILEAVRNICPQAKILVPGSAEEYGKVKPENMPIKETYPLNPRNPYGISKVAQEMLGKYYHDTYDMDIYLTRTFHYAGPDQPLGFVCSDFAKQIVDIEKGKKDMIYVGNLKAKRDFLDIRDAIRAYVSIVENGNPGSVYNVCSGKSISIEEIFNILIRNSTREIKMKVNKAKLRPIDVPELVGDNSKIVKETSWIPKIKIEKTLEDLLDSWRTR